VRVRVLAFSGRREDAEGIRREKQAAY